MKKQLDVKAAGNIPLFGVLYVLSALLLCLSMIFFMEGVKNAFCFYVAGAVFYLVSHGRMLYRGDDFRLKRLNRIFFLNIILLIGGGYLMFIGNNSFILSLLLLAVLELFRSLRISHYLKETQES